MAKECAVYTDEEYRGQGIGGKLLDLVVADMKSKGIFPVYLVTDHTAFYERYGWEFLCMVQGDGEPEMTKISMGAFWGVWAKVVFCRNFGF